MNVPPTLCFTVTLSIAILRSISWISMQYTRLYALKASYLGARGLMQIMPETFEWIRYKLDEENDPDMTFDNMYNAEDNIRYGCFLLGYLTDTFGELGEVAAAYHAGTGSVSSWLEDSRYTKNGILTDIPNPDTAHYVDKITNAYDTYCRLYKK